MTMKLKITAFEMIGGNHYTVIQLDDACPKELAELGGSKMIEVSEELGKRILKAQADAINFQVDLAYVHAGKLNQELILAKKSES